MLLVGRPFPLFGEVLYEVGDLVVEDLGHDFGPAFQGLQVTAIHFSDSEADFVQMVEVVLRLQVQICLEQKIPQYASRLLLETTHVADRIEVERLLYFAGHQSFKVSEILYLLVDAKNVLRSRHNRHVFL